MSDEITALKAALADLNQACQLARDNEVRYALQRGRLEAERAQLLVKLMDAMVAPAPSPEAAFLPPYRVVVHERPTAPPPPSAKSAKPDGIPTTAAMITAALQAAGTALRPVEIATYVRERWWPEADPLAISSVVCRMGADGRLSRSAGRYSLVAPLLNGGGVAVS